MKTFAFMRTNFTTIIIFKNEFFAGFKRFGMILDVELRN